MLMRMNLPVRMKRFDFHCTYASVIHRRNFRVPPVLYDLRDSSFEPQSPNDDKDERPVRAHDIRRSRLHWRASDTPVRDENFPIIENGKHLSRAWASGSERFVRRRRVTDWIGFDATARSRTAS